MQIIQSLLVVHYSTSYADPGLEMQEHLCFRNCNIFIQLYTAIAVRNVPLNAGLINYRPIGNLCDMSYSFFKTTAPLRWWTI
jgi:hypothetical protein